MLQLRNKYLQYKYMKCILNTSKIVLFMQNEKQHNYFENGTESINP